MPMQKVTLRPGINVQFTQLLNEGGFSGSQLTRWKDGLGQKLGGWDKYIQSQIVGTGRGSHAWADLDGNPYYAVGTEQRLQAIEAGVLIDITPVDNTANIAPAFSTTDTETEVTVTDVGHGAGTGDWINIVVPVSVGGIVLQGFYIITSVVDADNYTIESANPATATVAAGGAVPNFTTTNTLATVTVTLNDHGYSAGQQFEVQVSTTVGGLTLLGDYAVTSVTDDDNFVITDDTTAGSSTSGFENGGNARIQYLLPSGLASATPTSGYGVGIYGSGVYQASGSTVITPLRQWFLDNWGENLIGNYNGGGLYQWVPLSGNPAAVVSGAPTQIQVSLVAAPFQQVFAFGTETGGSFDPNLIRWSDVADNTDWTATSVNQAGSFRIPTGSRIVGALLAGRQIVIWTDVDCWVAQYVGAPFVWSFTRIGATGNDLIAARACCNQDDAVYWMTAKGYRKMSNGTVQDLPCSVWDRVFQNLNLQQADKIHLAPNSLFNEVTCYFPSLDGDGEIDQFVKFNTNENVWDYSVDDPSISIMRTCWEDQSVLGYPIGAGTDSYLYQHETSYDADGMPMNEWLLSGFIDIAEGNEMMFVERVIPDLKWFGSNPGTDLYIITQEYPGGEQTTWGPYTSDQTTQYIVIRKRARQIAFKIQGKGIGSAWRTGATRYLGQPAGRRP